MARHDEIINELSDGASRTTLFYDGPGEFLCRETAKQLLIDTVWADFFGPEIYGYKKMDFQIRALPGMRIYCDRVRKEAESSWITGELKADIILPPEIRRDLNQQVQDTVSHALLQQFRRPDFFELMKSIVPGLNELGRTFDIDKSLGFDFGDDEDVAPLTQISINFRLDLRQWDQYLEDTLRTKESPYAEVLKEFKRMVTTVSGQGDTGDEEIEIQVDQKPGVEE